LAHHVGDIVVDNMRKFHQEIGWKGIVPSAMRCDSMWKQASFLLASAVL
jgi:hypothetical protein